MAFIIKDRVKEGTISTGTGAIDLSGPSSTFAPFNSFMVDGDTTYYAIVHTTSGVDEWEVGLGTWNTGNTITRTTILSGSNGTSAVDFSSGIKDVFMTYPAAVAAYTDGSGSLSGDIDLGNHSTTELVEGSNLYYLDSRVDAHLSGGTGVTYSSGAISIGQDVATTSNVTFNSIVSTDGVTVGGNLEVSGDLVVSGTTTTINATELAIQDNMIYLNEGSTITNPDLGWVGNYNDGTYAHSGVFRDATDSTFKFFDGYTPEPGQAIDVTHASYNDADIKFGTAFGDITGNVTGDLTGNVTGNLTGNSSGTHTGSVIGNVTGNASTATKLATARTVQLSGDVTGSATFDGSANINITAAVQDGSHSHVVSNVDGLQTALDSKAPTARIITAGTGITGGGDLTANRTISLDTAYTDERYVNASGDTMTGSLAISGANVGLALTNTVNAGGATITFSDNVTQTGSITFFHSDGEAPTTGYGSTFVIGTSEATGPAVVIPAAGDYFVGSNKVFNDAYHPNADKLTTARNIALAGGVTGSANFDGSGNISITATVADDSHNHIISNVDGLQTALDGKLSTSGKAADSNLLDGIDSTGFALAQGRVVTDANAAAFRVPGMYGFNSNPTNGTGEAHGAMIVAANADTGLQIAGGHSNDDLYFRGWSGSGATYYPWRRVFHDTYHPNADTLTTARTIALAGDVTGSATFDGSENISITATVADDSHGHSFNNLLNKTGGTGNYTSTGTFTGGTFNATSTTGGGFQGIDADSATAPSFTWSADLNTGIYRPTTDQIGFTTAGVNRLTISTTGITSTLTQTAPTFNATSTTGGGFQGIDADSITAPSFTWSADLDTGIYRPTTNQIGFTTGGAQRGLFNSSGLTVTGNIAVTGTVDGRNVLADGQKLDGISKGLIYGLTKTTVTFNTLTRAFVARGQVFDVTYGGGGSLLFYTTATGSVQAPAFSGNLGFWFAFSDVYVKVSSSSGSLVKFS